MREIKFSFMWQDDETGRLVERRYDLAQIISGDPYDDFRDNRLLSRYHHVATRQYTGLLDKGGVEIYEGDIITGEDGNNDQVIYKENKFILDPLGDDCVYWDKCEVIGNIYENPDLLAKKEEGDKS